MYLNFEETKQAFLTLLERCKCYRPIELRTRLRIEKGLRESQTVNDLTECVANYMDELYAAYKNWFLELVRESLSPEDWKAQNIHFDVPHNPFPWPERVKYIVVSDGSMEMTQDYAGRITYYGNVNLTVLQGIAIVKGTSYPVKAYKKSNVCAEGETTVIATDGSYVVLKDYAKVEASGTCEIDAKDHAFVESRSNRVRISARCDSQVLIHGGVEQLELKDNARCVILGDGSVDRPIVSDMWFDTLLFTYEMDVELIHRKNRNCGIILAAEDYNLSASVLCDLIVPRHNREYKFQAQCIEVPLELSRLKNDLAPYLKGVVDELDLKAMELAKDEKEVCNIVKDYLIPLRNKGLDGEFLRSHFTNLTLLGCGIYSGVYPSHWAFRADHYDPKYYFGDRLVFVDDYGGKLYGFENTLFLSNCFGNHIDHADKIVKMVSSSLERVMLADNSTLIDYKQKDTAEYTNASLNDLSVVEPMLKDEDPPVDCTDNLIEYPLSVDPCSEDDEAIIDATVPDGLDEAVEVVEPELSEEITCMPNEEADVCESRGLSVEPECTSEDPIARNDREW